MLCALWKVANVAITPQTSGSLCVAIVTPSPGEITFPILKKHCDRGFAVSDEEALTAMAYAFKYLKLVLEPGGAVAHTTALFRKNELQLKPEHCRRLWWERRW